MRILVLGATGQFGKRLCYRLADLNDVILVMQGRNAERLSSLQRELIHRNPNATIETKSFDINGSEFESDITKCAPELVVHLAGPFQHQDYRVARSCLNYGINYIDMSDAREFVANFSALNIEAKSKNVPLITGASTLPGLSSAIIDEGLKQFSELSAIDYGISSGLKTGLGLATLQAVMSYCGKPFLTLLDGKTDTFYGLGRARKHEFPRPAGYRSFVDCDVPDFELFPKTYPTLKSIQFGACLDVPGLAQFLSILSYCVRRGFVRNWDFLSRFIKPIAQAIRFMGDYNSGFFMRLTGVDSLGKQKHILFEIIARDGSGLEIPVSPVMVLIKRMLKGERFAAGAYACQHLMSLHEIQQELLAYPITWNWKILQSRGSP